MLSLLLFTACTGSTPVETCASDVRVEDTASGLVDTEVGTGTLDLRATYPDPPENGYQIASPTLEIPPYSERFFCFYGTYEGPDTGVVSFWPYTVRDFNHHSFLRSATESEFEDGTLHDCLFVEGSFLFQAVVNESEAEDSGDWLFLPDGYAAKLLQGQRWVMDTHYINPTEQTLLVNDVINMEFVPVDTVTNWIAAYEASEHPLIPPNSTYSLPFDCTWEQEFEFLTLFGHMHEYGDSFQVEWQHDGVSEMVYAVDQWRPDYRENNRQITTMFAPGEFVVESGDVFTITCTWTNPTDQAIEHPSEMCSLHGIVSPTAVPVFCQGSAGQSE